MEDVVILLVVMFGLVGSLVMLLIGYNLAVKLRCRWLCHGSLRNGKKAHPDLPVRPLLSGLMDLPGPWPHRRAR